MNEIANLPKPKYKRIVVVGGGFGGLKLARLLYKSGYQVVVLDKNNYHQFQPLLYQIATAGLEPSAISFPFRKLFQKQERMHFRIAELLKVEPEKNEITTSIGKLDYDFLVIAAGLTTNFFGNENIRKNALPMKSVSDAILIRNTILQNYEAALNQTDSLKKEAHLNVVVVGGGPTGVEMAGALAEMKKYILPNDYPELDFALMNIYLFEASPKLLNVMSEKSSVKAKQYLEKLGVIVKTDTYVKDYDGNNVLLNDGTKHSTYNLVWAAGVMPISFQGLDAASFGKGKRILVNEFNQAKGYSNIYALGDIAEMQSKDFPKGHPQVVPVAIQQAKNMAENFIKLKNGKQPKAFHYVDKGSLATIGRHLAVADLPYLKTQGFFAWVMWLFVHIMMLIGFKNKIVVMIDWAWSYLFSDQALRLLIKPSKRNKLENGS
jgi:NADH:ubiquinone reductase (H+-translocating)